MAGMLRVLVVDDHEMFSEALALLFGREPGIELVAAFPAGEEAVARCRVEAAGRGPHGRGPSRYRRHRGHPADPRGLPSTRVVVLTAMQNPSLIISAMAAGACGYMSKTRAADALVDVVRRAASGEIVMSDDELPIVLDELRTGREPTVVAELALRRLTARETEILRALFRRGHGRDRRRVGDQPAHRPEPREEHPDQGRRALQDRGSPWVERAGRGGAPGAGAEDPAGGLGSRPAGPRQRRGASRIR